jgi:alkylation response protein AidB-like acyl-CoA dehydrogenase
MTAATSVDARDCHERRELRDTVARFVSRVASQESFREVLETAGYVEDLWTGLGDLGMTAILVPEEYGGAGGTLGDVVVVLEELGKVPTAVPYLSSAVLATFVIAALGDNGQQEKWLPGLASGDLVATVATCGPSGRPDVASLGIVADRGSGKLLLSGTATFVPDAGRADILVLACRDGDGVLFVVVNANTPGVTVTDTPCFDLTRRFADVRCADVVVDPVKVLADVVRGTEVFDQLLAVAALAIAADSLGGLETVTALSSQYAKDRIQFGKPIGSFQAIKHLCADMAIAVATARVAVDNAYRSGVAAQVPSSIAKSYAAAGYAKAAGDCVQVHGGIGFTWEHDAHVFLRRAKLNEALYGDLRWHRERIASHAVSEWGAS